MHRYALMVLFAWAILIASNIRAKDVELVPGETFSKDNFTITCGQSTTHAPLALNDFQYWDDFSNKYLFEKTIYMNKNLEGVEECQRWDKFASTCFYQPKCNFYTSHMIFVRTTSEKFDDFNNTCLKMEDTKIGR